MSANYTMNEPHSHPFYEIYVLLEGTRDMYYKDKVLRVLPKNFCVIPPFVIHKTDGGPYTRINIILQKSLLSYSEIDFLNNLATKGVLSFQSEYTDLCIDMLKKACLIEDTNHELHGEYKNALIKSVLFYMQNQKLQSYSNSENLYNETIADPLVSKIINYMHEHYSEKIDLDSLSNHFFISKTSLCNHFKKSMNCSIMAYISKLRINKSMDLLLYSNYNIEKISELCGFLSSNYFRLIFKKVVGLSPLKYRKYHQQV